MKRRENFPIESLLHLEQKLQALRVTLMKVAAEFASAGRDVEVYTVTCSHVDAAWKSEIGRDAAHQS